MRSRSIKKEVVEKESDGKDYIVFKAEYQKKLSEEYIINQEFIIEKTCQDLWKNMKKKDKKKYAEIAKNDFARKTAEPSE